ncbi:hypothetical protein OCGS_1659 [Oceaniovalibus guishaninsula JLT2003]|uniref:PAS fold-4 domain-containing protein n=1 Tax=Oceaniovalibus guishaninsula JLT2003 TaxID=1231392 RepID=K2H9D5_9RHOB|nr:PAS domain-containing protein [Oceaniovalibus guishaninsula]EKE44143.1 hypothetical protein OCGS_1659 [Oceaniovalibus guishaninsula JLT2003]
MQIVSLISDLMFTDAQLQASMAANTAPELRAELLRRSAILLQQVERYEPEGLPEIREKIAFFMRRATMLGRTGAGRHDMQIAAGLMDHLQTAATGRSPRQGRMPEGALADGGRLSVYVTQASERLFAIGTDHRYLAASRSEARFHERSQVQMIGRHLRDVLGPEEYERRALPHLQACLSGVPQEYRFAVERPDEGRRTIRCLMKPVTCNAGLRFCALVYKTDVTDEGRAQTF